MPALLLLPLLTLRLSSGVLDGDWQCSFSTPKGSVAQDIRFLPHGRYDWTYIATPIGSPKIAGVQLKAGKRYVHRTKGTYKLRGSQLTITIDYDTLTENGVPIKKYDKTRRGQSIFARLSPDRIEIDGRVFDRKPKPKSG